MKKTTTAILAASCLLLASGSAFAEEAYVAPVKAYVEANIKPWLNDPVIIDAIKAQDAANANISQASIDSLDKKWRAEVDSSDRSFIDKVLAKKISVFLKKKQDASQGMITEMFVMDDKGLNVGQSDMTSDYWQGDEAKWKKSYGMGAGAIFIDAPEKDESTQTLQSQASLTISDENGKPIGAITIGINLDDL